MIAVVWMSLEAKRLNLCRTTDDGSRRITSEITFVSRTISRTEWEGREQGLGESREGPQNLSGFLFHRMTFSSGADPQPRFGLVIDLADHDATHIAMISLLVA